MENGNIMNSKNQSGLWFYGPKRNIEEFKKYLKKNFNLDVEYSLYFDSEEIYYANPGEFYVEWTKKGLSDFDEAKNHLPYIDLNSLLSEGEVETVEENSESDEEKFELILSPGITLCNETCIFYRFCDGERGSIYNPSHNSGTFPCNKYKLNSYEIKKRRI